MSHRRLWAEGGTQSDLPFNRLSPPPVLSGDWREQELNKGDHLRDCCLIQEGDDVSLDQGRSAERWQNPGYIWKEANGVLSWLWIQREKQLSPILGVVIVMNTEKNTFCTALWSSCKAMHSYLPQTMKQWELASDLVAYWSSNQQFYKISSSFVTVSIIYDSASSNSSKVYLTWTEHKKMAK